MINLSLIYNSGNIDPEGIYLGSAIKDLHAVIKEATNNKGNHSLKIFINFLFM